MNRMIEGNNGEILRIHNGKFSVEKPKDGKPGKRKPITRTKAIAWYLEHEFPKELIQ